MGGQVVGVVGAEDSFYRAGKADAWGEASRWAGSGKSCWRMGKEGDGDGGRLESDVLVVEGPSVISAPSCPSSGNT